MKSLYQQNLILSFAHPVPVKITNNSLFICIDQVPRHTHFSVLSTFPCLDCNPQVFLGVNDHPVEPLHTLDAAGAHGHIEACEKVRHYNVQLRIGKTVHRSVLFFP